jgi:hypothetical protein
MVSGSRLVSQGPYAGRSDGSYEVLYSVADPEAGRPALAVYNLIVSDVRFRRVFTLTFGVDEPALSSSLTLARALFDSFRVLPANQLASHARPTSRSSFSSVASGAFEALGAPAASSPVSAEWSTEATDLPLSFTRPAHWRPVEGGWRRATAPGGVTPIRYTCTFSSDRRDPDGVKTLRVVMVDVTANLATTPGGRAEVLASLVAHYKGEVQRSGPAARVTAEIPKGDDAVLLRVVIPRQGGATNVAATLIGIHTGRAAWGFVISLTCAEEVAAKYEQVARAIFASLT